MNCVVCDKPISKKARTCSAKCRKQVQRQAPSVTSVTVRKCDMPSVTTFELCRYCSKPLPPLAKLRHNPGACYDCAIKQPHQCSLDALGELVHAGSEYVPPID